ncbi:Uncharacterised protein [Sphingobacterium spiritivorum]|uniref:Uncharacterized protein n=1 Tax=Sphingobacterium spiritivorum TaxID=258 RepID=A0A380BNU5_SPHSI|nr:hypothetical protein [Sphingobacterium spiritivorum]SUJ03417.1 Uncharacterised protein [Sphingobacterium spiritivorum]
MKAIHNLPQKRKRSLKVVVNIIKSKNRPHGSSAIPLKNKLLMANESNSQPTKGNRINGSVVVNIIKSKNRPNGSSAIPLKNKLLMANESNSQH